MKALHRFMARRHSDRYAIGVLLLLIACFARPAAANEGTIAFTGCNILPGAGEAAITDGVLLVRGGKIEAVGGAGDVEVPSSAERVDCAGGTLAPGFWNSHVHFMGPVWEGAADAPADRLADGLEAMLTRYGVAHAVDTGSTLADTLALKRRIASGEIAGPTILSAGSAFVGPNGTPFYLPGVQLPELHGPEQARAMIAREIADGAEAIKLMSVSLTREQPFPFIPVETIRAVAEEAHRSGAKVLVHPTDRKGVELALDGGADVIVHTAPIGGPWEEAFAKRLAEAGIALVPTLKLWPYELAQANDPAMLERFVEVSQQQVAAFRAAGGRVLFGTDVGYMRDFDPAEEYVQMAAAGMSADDILAALTVNPVAVFGNPSAQGRLAPGYDADLVLLANDPASDVEAFADVRMTYRGGKRIYVRD